MNLQGRNLTTQMQGNVIQLLLSQLLRLSHSIRRSRKKLFGEATHNAVLDFQQRQGLEATGVVDEHIAQRISAAVEALSHYLI